MSEIVKAVEQVRDAAERNAKLSEQLSSLGLTMISQSRNLEEAIKAFHLSDELTSDIETKSMAAVATRNLINVNSK
jgi:hypothetical protein